METSATRKLHIKRTFRAPVELMWEVWTKPEHISQWWGPHGFTTTIHLMHFEEEGEWKLTMHGPDGTNYPNRSIFKEIIPLKRIVYQHFNPNFIATALFESKGNETTLDWTLEFETAELYQAVVKAHKADQGMVDNVERLKSYLERMQG